jgi:hypothetical protein
MASMRYEDMEGLNLINTSPGTNGCTTLRSVLPSATIDAGGLGASQAVKNRLMLARRTCNVRRTRIRLYIGLGAPSERSSEV